MADRLVTAYPDGHELRVSAARPPQYLTRWRIQHPVGCLPRTTRVSVHTTEVEAMVQLVNCGCEPCEVG